MDYNVTYSFDEYLAAAYRRDPEQMQKATQDLLSACDIMKQPWFLESLIRANRTSSFLGVGREDG